MQVGANALHSWLCAGSRAFFQHCWTFPESQLLRCHVFLQWYLSWAARTRASFCWSQFCSVFPGKLFSGYIIYIIKHSNSVDDPRAVKGGADSPLSILHKRGWSGLFIAWNLDTIHIIIKSNSKHDLVWVAFWQTLWSHHFKAFLQMLILLSEVI